MIEKTLVIFKPDVIMRGVVGEITARFEKVGMKIVGMKMILATEEQLKEHYQKDDEWLIKKGEGIKKNKGYPEDYDAKKAGQEIIDGLIKDMRLSPVIAIVLEGHNAVKVVKKLTGPTNIEEALPGTIRGDYSHDTFGLANVSDRPILTIIHTTDDPAEAKREIDLWFKPEEMHSYEKADSKVHYRKLN